MESAIFSPRLDSLPLILSLASPDTYTLPAHSYKHITSPRPLLQGRGVQTNAVYCDILPCKAAHTGTWLLTFRKNHCLHTQGRSLSRRWRQKFGTNETTKCHDRISKPTPWIRVLLEKLTGPQLMKKLSAFYGTLSFITVFTTAHHLSLS